MAYLKREVPFSGAPRPDLILLDLNLPKIDGARSTAAYQDRRKISKPFPVVILTTSETEHDIATHTNITPTVTSANRSTSRVS